MRRLSRLAFAGVAIAFLCIQAPSLSAQTQALTFTGGTPGANNNQSIGWQFNVLAGVTVNGLGWFDDGADGLSVAHDVGIWNPLGVLLASITVPGGTVAALDGGFRTVFIPDVFLPVGNGYIIGGENSSRSTDKIMFNVASQTVNPNLQFVDATFSNLNSSLERPTFFSGADNGFYGVGFTTQDVVATPEPGTYALFATGLVGIAFSRRRRKV